MTVETAFNIWQLNELLPDYDDDIGEAQEHLGIIKGSLLSTFPNFTKDAGYVTISSDELNQFDSIYKTVPAVGNPVSATIEGTIKASAYNTDFKNMVFKFDPINSTLLKLAQPTVPLGSIVASMLSQIQMDSLHGSGNFLLCNGDPIPDTSYLRMAYGTATRFKILPDLRDRIPSQAPTIAPYESNLNLPFPSKTRWIRDTDFTYDIDPLVAMTSDTHNHDGYPHTHDLPIKFHDIMRSVGFSDNYTIANIPHPDRGGPPFTRTVADSAAVINLNIDAHSHVFNGDTTIISNGFNFPNRAVINYYMRVN